MIQIFADQADARTGEANSIVSGSSPLFSVATKVKAPVVKPYLATADVASERGPFLEFLPATVATTDVTEDVGVLATIAVTENETGFLDPDSGLPADLRPDRRQVPRRVQRRGSLQVR